METKTKDDEQNEIVKKFRKHKGTGTIVAYTGFGKTHTAIKCKKDLDNAFKRKINTVVIAPTNALVHQWQQKLTKANINADVRTIQSVIYHKEVIETELLILDEYHRVGSDKFIEVTNLVKRQFTLGLTATIHRGDGKDEILEKICPVIHEVPIERGIYYGWLPDFKCYMLPIELKQETRELFDYYNKMFNKHFAIFSHDFDAAMNCQKKRFAEEYAYRHQFSDIDLLMHHARQFNKFLQLRKKLFYNADEKIEIIQQIVNKTSKKTIIFGESNDFADKAAEALGDKFLSFHSGKKSVEVTEKRHKFYKTYKGALKFKESHNGQIVEKDGGYEVIYKVKVKYGKKRARQYDLKRLADNRYKIRGICAARSLDEGLDIEDLSLGILASYTSTPRQFIQRLGRVLRFMENKSPCIIIPFVDRSQEKRWLKNGMKNVPVKYKKYVKSINEINV